MVNQSDVLKGVSEKHTFSVSHRYRFKKKQYNKNMEEFPTQENQNTEDEISQTSLQIIEADNQLSYEEETPVLKEGVIIHYKTAIPGKPEGINKFRLLRQIGSCHYIFSLAESFNQNTFTINFKTEEYEYARIDLSKDEREELGKNISSLVESVDAYSGISLEVIMVWSADASYTSEQIENCIVEIVKNDSEFTRESLLNHYNGFRFFELYNS